MKKFLYFSTALAFFSLGGIKDPLQAEKTARSMTESKEKPGYESREAAWVIECAQVAKDYVDRLDRGQYVQSWSKGDLFFQHAVSQKEWMQLLNSTRKKLGSVRSRALRNQQIAWNPVGMPQGAYMVIEFKTAFENSPSSKELLTLRRGSDGIWRVLTYQAY